MKTRLQTVRALETADWITNQLLKRKESYSSGILFKTVSLNAANEYIWKIDDGIYGGNAGILLYLAAALKASGSTALRESVIQLANGLFLYCEKHESQYYGFLTGRLGVAYALFQAAELTGLQELRDIGTRILQIERFQLLPLPKWADYISGKAGMLLGLICLHDYLPDPRLVHKADECAMALVKDAEFGNKGLYWDRTQYNRYGLCGVGHGASGVAGPLLEYASWIGNSEFNILFEEARRYEAQFLNRKSQNWADMRMMHSTTEESSETKKQLFSGDLSSFSKAGDMNAWCHGAAGIGLVRLRAYELIKGRVNRRELNMALSRVMRDLGDRDLDTQSAVLCHGLAGNCELLLSTKFHLGTDSFDATINAVVNAIHGQASRHGRILCGFKRHNLTDNSLFTGLAGIGHFLLRVNDPTIPSILCCHPRSRPSSKGEISSHVDIASELAKKAYPNVFQTVKSSQQENCPAPRHTISAVRLRLPSAVRAKVAPHMPSNASCGATTRKAFRLDTFRHKLEFDQPFSLLYLRREIMSERMAPILANNNVLNSSHLETNTDMYVIEETAKTWRRVNLLRQRAIPGAKRLILIPEWFGVTQYEADESLLLLLHEFSKPTQVEKVIDRVVNKCSTCNEDSDFARIKQLLLINIRECLRAQLLFPTDCRAMFRSK